MAVAPRSLWLGMVRGIVVGALALEVACSAIVSKPATHRTVTPEEFGRTFSEVELAEDLRFERRVIEEVHPRPNERLSDADFDALVGALQARIDRPMTRVEFWPIAAELATAMHDAHTTVGAPGEEWIDFLAHGGGILPIGFGVRDGDVVVGASHYGESGPPPGSIVRRIDDIDIDALAAEYVKERAGVHDFVLANFAGGLPYHLWRVGVQAPFDVTVESVAADGAHTTKVYRDLAGWTTAEIGEKNRANASPPKTASAPKTASPPQSPDWSLRWLEHDIALIDFRHMNNFEAWDRFLEATFAEIKERDAKGVIIDLRGNGGGDSSLGDRLLEYLTDKPFRSCARKEWRSSAQYRKYMKDHVVWWLRWMPLQYLHAFGRKFWGVDEGGIAVFEVEPKVPEPNQLRYRGPWCLLIGPQTFSSAIMLANSVGDYRMAPLFGEPTGAAPNAYGEIYACDLPHTRLELNVSSAYFVRANGDGDDPHPVLPTVEIVSTADDLARGRDPVLDAARAWVLEVKAP